MAGNRNPSKGHSRRGVVISHLNRRMRNGRSMSPRLSSSSGTRSSSPGPTTGSSSPLRGRSREPSRRADNDSEGVPSDEEQDTSIDNISDDYLSFKGRIFGRFRLMWEDLRPIVEEGMLLDAGKQLRRRRWVSEYKDLVALAHLVPDLVLDIGEGGLHHVTGELDQARSKARAADVGTMKQHVHRWRDFVPPIDAVDSRHRLGFHNMTTGYLLCPCDLNWNDLSIQKSLQEGTRKVQPKDFPLFLWKSERVSATDFFDGFMQGDMILKAFLHIFIGPSAAHSSASGRSTRKGNAALHGIRTVSIYSIAYAATIFRFVISDQSVLSQGGSGKGRWPYKEFYDALVNAMKDMEDDDLADLLDWWQDTVFGGLEEEAEDEDHGVTSVAARMRAQAADKKARKAASAAAAAASES
ncbi:hypothetical protein B0H34DRAFT_706322 [Crassisporium funariophilum]|nr:hypothetical protein B0H34DRAFT_706322 [Crassisporium funariophilum]